MARNKWAVKNKFEDVMNHIRDLNDTDLIKHSQMMAKNATYMSHFTIYELTKLEVRLSRNLLSFNDSSILTDESSDRAGRAQLAIFVCYIDPSTNKPKEYVCIRKLNTSKIAENLMQELKQIFTYKNIDKTHIQFFGFDVTNVMSGKQKGLKRRICHVSLYALYLNCKNYCLALCLVHLLKKYDDLVSVDTSSFNMENFPLQFHKAICF